MHKDFEKPMYL